MEFHLRVGTFFVIIGLTLLLLFVGSVLGKETNGILLFLSFSALIVGVLLRRDKSVKESERFGILRRMNERKLQRRREQRNRGRKGGVLSGRRRPAPTTGSENEEENTGNEE